MRRGTHKGYRWKSQREGDRQEDQVVGGMITLGWILERLEGVMWFGLVWLGMGTGEGFL
jgi:hypothetical protein